MRLMKPWLPELLVRRLELEASRAVALSLRRSVELS
jgi:hypothetical protein